MEDGYTWNVFPKKRIGFLAYEREKDYLCKVKVMDIPQSIMQRTGWHPMTTDYVCHQAYTRDDMNLREQEHWHGGHTH